MVFCCIYSGSLPNSKYQKKEFKITWQDIEDRQVPISNNFSTQTSYENQTKKSITNRFVQTAMAEFLKEQLQIYFTESPNDIAQIVAQILVNKRNREKVEETRQGTKKRLSSTIDIVNRVQKFVDCRTKDIRRKAASFQKKT